MNTREYELSEYLKNSRKADLLNQQIQELEDELKQIDKVVDSEMFREHTADILLEEAHSLRLKKLGLELNLNTLERKMLQFELATELRD